MRLKIILTGLLDEDGYHNSSGNGLWKVTLGSLIVARGKRESKLYMTHPKISKSIVNAVDNDDITELWNKRLGHMIGEKVMSILFKKNMLSRVHDINLKKCSHCLTGKQTRLAFKSRSPFRMENILDLASCIIPKMKDSKLDYKVKPAYSSELVFEKDQTLKDVENAERETIPQHNDDLIDLDLVPPKHFDSQRSTEIIILPHAILHMTKVVSSPLTTNFKLILIKNAPLPRRKYRKDGSSLISLSGLEALMYAMISARGAVSWQSRLQKCVHCLQQRLSKKAQQKRGKELLWLKRFLQKLGSMQQRYAFFATIKCYSLAKNSMFHKRNKNNIDIPLSLIRDAIEDG
ncbi:retrovirus-related pol polyprotein from transposon TNT 1-94 [Tanacetum coccineum]